MISQMYGENSFKEAFKDEMRVLVKHFPEHLESLKINDKYLIPVDWKKAPDDHPLFTMLFHKDRFQCLDRFAEAEENLELQDLTAEPEAANFVTSCDKLEMIDEDITYLAAKRKYIVDKALKSFDLPSMNMLQSITKARAELRHAIEREANHQLQQEFPFSQITRITMEKPLQDAVKQLIQKIIHANEEMQSIEDEIEKLQLAQRSLCHKKYENFPLLEYYEMPLNNDRESIIKQNISKRIYALQAQLYELKKPSSLSLLGLIQEYINQELPPSFINNTEDK